MGENARIHFEQDSHLPLWDGDDIEEAHLFIGHPLGARFYIRNADPVLESTYTAVCVVSFDKGTVYKEYGFHSRERAVVEGERALSLSHDPTPGRPITQAEWDSKHDDFKGWLLGVRYMMGSERGGSYYGPVHIVEADD